MISRTPDSDEQPPAIPPHESAMAMIMNRIGKFCASRLPKNWGFAIFCFPFDGKSGLRFISNGSLRDVVKLLNEFVRKHKNLLNDPEPTNQKEIPPPPGDLGRPGDSPVP